MSRIFKIICLILLVLIGIAGCKKEKSTGNQEKSGDISISEDFKEAPLLSELVKKGELPRVEERLPVKEDVMIEEVTAEIGVYGGSITMTTNDRGHWRWGSLTEQSMFRFKQDGSGEVEANVCKSYSSNEDSTVWTIELRKGMHWSDGKPFTADDVLFYYNHMSTPALKADRIPVPVDDPAYYNAFTTKPYRCYYVEIDGKNHWAQFKKIDDYKLTVTFAAPKPNFPVNVAVDNKWMFAPKHFFKNFVARKDGVKNDPGFPLITEEEAIYNANQMFNKKWNSYSTMGKSIGYYNWDYYQVPQLRSFIATKNNWNKIGETYELVRNPYFFKTDRNGNQLPYLDSIKIQIINETDQATLKATAGEFDVFYTTADVFSTVASSTRNSHRISKWKDVYWASFGFCLNQTVNDLDKRKLYQNTDFRQVLSIAVDRTLLNATLANNQAQPWQLSPSPGMLGADKEWAKKWTEYNVEKANKLLDSLSEAWDRTDGTYRKIKGTNKELELIFYLNEKEAQEKADFISLLKTAYKKIGVKVSDKVESDVAKTILANEHDITVDLLYGISPALRPDTMIPMRNYMGWYGAYGKWYEDNKSEANGGIKPDGDVMALIEAYDAIATAKGPGRQQVIAENIKKIYQLHQKNVWVIGFLSQPPYKYLVNNKLKNFPDGLIRADEFRLENMARPEQLFIKE